MQKIDYRYNVRGWLTRINDSPYHTLTAEGDKFGMKISYNRQPNGGTSGVCRNGNIHAMQWGTPKYKNLQYTFAYDNTNRLTSANFLGNGFSFDAYDTDYTYNKNGNLTYAWREGRYGYIDNLDYNYNGNKLSYVRDFAPEHSEPPGYPGTESFLYFDYDGNGNMTYEPNKSASVTYNLFNLPYLVDFGNNNRIRYTCNTEGKKVHSGVFDTNGNSDQTYYCGLTVHRMVNYGTRSLKYIITPEGRIINNGTDSTPVWSWEYDLKDHLGNTRVVVKPATNPGYATVLQETNYFPFGMRISQLCSTFVAGTNNRYLYNGKELQDDFGLNWYDYGARFYDPALGRFHTQDRFAEKYMDFTPYQYGANNPIKFIDINGDSLYVANNEYTHNDIKGLAKKTNQQYICFNKDGSVTLDFSGVDAKTQKKALKDKGLQTISNLVESKDADGNTENYYYEASNTREGVLNGEFFSINLDKNAGKETGLNDNSFATNLSITPLGVPGTPNVTPANGYDGAVYISPGTMYDKGVGGNEITAPRSSLVRHELNESYNRTHKKMSYSQAHGSAGGVGTYTRFVYAPLNKK